MYGICNVVGASIPRNTDSGTYIHVGPEIGVASTKAFTGQVTVLMLLALCVGQMRGTVDDATVERIVRELKNMPVNTQFRAYPFYKASEWMPHKKLLLNSIVF